MGPRRSSRSEGGKRRPGKRNDRRWALPPAIFLWSVVIHLAFLGGNVDRLSPDSLFFDGESRQILLQAGELAASADLSTQWSLQTSTTVWLMVPLCRLITNVELLNLSGKVAMVVLNGLFFALLYIPLSERLPRLAAPICFLMPLSFGEMLLSSAVSSDVVYRLLLLVIVTLGWRWPLFAGVLHALAAATQIEHLAFVILVAAVLALRLPEKRKNIAVSGTTFGILLLASFFLGPGASPPRAHTVLGLSERPAIEAIESDATSLPSRMISSFGVASYGWTWRDFPKLATWVREPGDLAHSPTRWYAIAAFALIFIGFSRLHGDRELLILTGLLLGYRLATIALGAPPLRAMMICSPIFLIFLLTGAATLLGRFANRGFVTAIVILGLMHLPSAWRQRRYLELGARSESNKTTGHRSVTLVYQGRYQQE